MSDIQYVTLPKFDSFEGPLHIAVFKAYAATFQKLKIRKLENRKVGIWNLYLIFQIPDFQNMGFVLYKESLDQIFRRLFSVMVTLQ